MSLITLGLALDYKTEGGLAATDPITVSSRPFFWQQMERTRANFVTLEDLAAVKHVQVTLTDAQVKALPTTPITLIAAPGSGSTIVPLQAILRATCTAGAYTNINATICNLAVYWLGDFSTWPLVGVVNDSSASPSPGKVTTFLGGANKHIAILPAYTDNYTNNWNLPPVIGDAIYENKAIAIAVDNNGSGNFTGGNAANTLRVDVIYLVL